MRAALLSLVLLAAACGSDLPPCSGACATLTVKVALTDASAAPVSCSAAGVDKIALTLEFEGKPNIERSFSCSAGKTEIGPIAVGVYAVTAKALDSQGQGLAQNTRTAQLLKADAPADVEVSLVPGPPSKLGVSCTGQGTCPSGYDCVQVDFGGGPKLFCTMTCGTSSMTQSPTNGDLACQRGYTGGGVPSCLLTSDGTGDVPWSCAIACGAKQSCPTGMTCYNPGGGNAVCVNAT